MTVDWILRRFSTRRAEACKQYRSFVSAGIGARSPWEDLKAQCILGGREFIEKLSPALRDRSELSEIPRRERFVHRPRLEDMMDEGRLTSMAERNEAIVLAHLEYGYTLSEIARHAGLHYTTISKVVGAHLKTL